MAHTSDDPANELKEALFWLDTLDEMVRGGEFSADVWYKNTRDFLNEMLQACETPLPDEREEISVDESNKTDIKDSKSSDGKEDVVASANPSRTSVPLLMCVFIG